VVVPTKQCGSIISTSYISWLLAAHGEKLGGCKTKQGGISKPALLCRDYLSPRGGELTCEIVNGRVFISGKAIKYLEGKIEI
jgi:hypothetical protein